MMLPTEPIGSIPRPLQLIEALEQCGGDDPSLVPRLEKGARDDRSTSRATAFAKIRARVAGTALASEILGVSE